MSLFRIWSKAIINLLVLRIEEQIVGSKRLGDFNYNKEKRWLGGYSNFASTS